MNPPTRATLKWLVTISILYIVLSLIATGIAIAENRSTQFGGSSTGLSAWQSFLYGQGTAMSPPLYWLVAQGILIALALRRDRWGAISVIGLAIFGLFFVIGALGEPIFLETFNLKTFNLLNAMVLVGMTVLPLVIMILSILEWLRRRRETIPRRQMPSQSTDSQ